MAVCILNKVVVFFSMSLKETLIQSTCLCIFIKFNTPKKSYLYLLQKKSSILLKLSQISMSCQSPSQSDVTSSNVLNCYANLICRLIQCLM